MRHRFTVWSLDPLASRPSSNGEKTKSVTVSEWPSIRGMEALSGRPLAVSGRTARLEPRVSQLKAICVALAAI